MIRQPRKPRAAVGRSRIIVFACFVSTSCLIAFPVGCDRTNVEKTEPSKQIVGLWKDSEQIWIFHPDGTFRVDELDNESGSDGSSGSWVIDDQILKIHFGFGTTGQDLEIPIQINDEGHSLTFDGQRKLVRNLEMQKQYNEITGRLDANLPENGG
jgi:hypothetical protein